MSDNEAREILAKILNDKECIKRIKEIKSLNAKRVYSSTGISENVLSLEDSVAQHYILGTFPGCVVISRTTVEKALKEELAKKGYPDRCLNGLNLNNIIESAKEEGIISKDLAKKAHKLREIGNKYAHANAKNANGKKASIGMIAKSPTRIEDWIITMEFIENQKPDAKKSFEDVVDILSELYSEDKYPV